MQHLLRRVARVFAIAGGALACGVALMTVTSILMRSFGVRPIQGDVELTQFGIAICITLCLPWCQLQGANIIVDFFTQRLADHRNRRLDALGQVLLAVMCTLLSWRAGAGALAVQGAGETTMILGRPMWWVYAALAPGLALTALVSLYQAICNLRGQGLEIAA
jgi:TRAP-type C4-dicarboxylate transport system permease small subunit